MPIALTSDTNICQDVLKDLEQLINNQWSHPYRTAGYNHEEPNKSNGCIHILWIYTMDASTVDGYIHRCIHSGRLYPWMHPESMDASILRGYIHGCIHRVWIYPWMHPQSPWMHPYCVDISMDAST